MNIKSITLGLGLCIASTSASALNIALTNDDGWSTPGIQVMYQALVDAGHTVTLAAPLNGQSGSGTGINIGSLEITKQAENQFSVALPGGVEGAEPATSGAVATQISADLTGQQPDLLISGINDGANLSAATITSGTVGAAVHSVGQVLGTGSVPAIAISTDERCDEDAGITPECREVAEFLVDYIAHLEQRPNFRNGRSPFIQRQQALNINFPPGEPRGVVVAKQGQLPLLGGAPRSLLLGCATNCNDLEVGDFADGGIVGTRTIEEKKDIANADSDLYQEGFITVVVINADLGANARGLKSYLNSYNY